MTNISSIHSCYGCGVCAMACAKNIIEIGQNADGFYEPHITDSDKCTNCGLCLKVCAYSHDKPALQTDTAPTAFAAWSNNAAVRRRCSSGGVGYEVGRTIIAEGGAVCGVRYDAVANLAEHYMADTEEALIPSIGSKYIQSYTVDGFLDLKRRISEDKKASTMRRYLVTGSPCQIDSVRRWAQLTKNEGRLLLLDFFCHGVPSKLMWDKYVASVEKKVGKLTYVSWRNKRTGWHDSWAMAIDGEDAAGEEVNWHDSYNLLTREKKTFLYSRLSQGDMFYRLFLGDQCLGKACYEHCKYKYDHSSADIRIGDAWGKTYAHDEKGVSAAIAFTPVGEELLRQCDCQLIEHPFDVVAEGQMKTMPVRNKLYEIISPLLKDKNIELNDIENAINTYRRRERMIDRMKHPMRTILNLIKRVLK